jgi:nonribosomal peptide synthetase DhbF
LGEIEAALLTHPRVRQAVALAREDKPGEKQLIAYTVADQGMPIEARELRAHLKKSLPNYMIPHLFVALDEIPLTATGKFDHKALPAPRANADARHGSTASRSATEDRLVPIWGDILKLESIGIDDNFFEIGGHSLLAVKLINAVHAELGVKLPLQVLFGAPSIHEFAALIDENLQSGKIHQSDLEPILPIATGGARPPLFCIHPGIGISWCYLGLAAHLGTDRPIYGLQARGIMPGEVPFETMRLLAEDYLTRIREIQPAGPYHLLGWSFGGVAAHEIACLLTDAGEDVAFLCILDSTPAHGQLDAAVATDQDVLRNLLDGVGCEIEPLTVNGEIEFSAALLFLKSNGYVPAEFEEANLLLLANVARNLARLNATFVPRKFNGDLLYFAATRDVPDTAARLNAWSPYIAGRISLREIDSGHTDMFNAEPAAEIGRLLQRELKALP